MDENSRPYHARIKESIFNLLRGWFEDARVLDLFAGVGTVGIEAVSRGAKEVLMVELSRDTHKRLQQNIDDLGCGDRATAMLGDSLSTTVLLRAPRPVDLVFVDPPYDMMRDEKSRQRVLDQIERCREIMATPSFVVLRSPEGPDEVDLTIPGFDGPEPHHYGRDRWVLLYAPSSVSDGESSTASANADDNQHQPDA